MISSIALTDRTKFDPLPGDAEGNISKANALLDNASPQQLDLLVPRANFFW